jgi:multicomponent Na+:H+ antiporter subunit E
MSTSNDLHDLQNRMVQLLLINCLIALLAPLFFTVFAGGWDYLLAFGVGALLLGLADRRYARHLWYGSLFLLYLLWQIIIENVSMAYLVLQPHPKLDPGIVGIPLTVDTGLEITILATAINLTPGTLSIDLGRDRTDRPVLYVHSLRVGDPQTLRTSLQQGFERMILRISRGMASQSMPDR